MRAFFIIACLQLSLCLFCPGDIIPTLFSTGIGTDGALLGPNGVVDPHYSLTESGDDDYPGPDAVTLNPGFPVGPWLEEGPDSEFPDSRWLAPRREAGSGNSPGEYRYQTTFNLAGFDLSTVQITGRWASDDGGPDLLLNGESLFLTSIGFGGWADFEITEGFVPGDNTLEFVVSNGGEARNPSGIRVEILSATGDTSDDAPPSIAIGPSSRRAIEGDTVSLSVTAGGTAPFTYQWQRNGEDVDGANDRILEFESITEEQAGDYTVTATNNSGTATSEAATVEVFQRIPGLFATGVDDDGNALDDLEVDPHYTLFENADGESVDTLVHDSSVFPIVEGPWLANTDVSKWIAPRGDTAEAAGGDYAYRVELDLTGFEPSTAFVRGNWSTDNAGLDIRINGATTGVTNGAQFGSLSPFTIDEAPFISGINTIDFVLNNAGAGPTALRVEGLTGGALPAVGGAKPPVIIVEPTGVEALLGEDVALKSLADGDPPLTYTWRLNGEDVGDMPELTLTDIQPEQAGDYTVEISNAEGSVTSMVATIVILEPIPGLFNTGQAEDGSLTDDMEPEVHYELIMDPNEEGLEAIVLNSTVFPIVSGPWVPNSETSKWIGVGEDNNGPVGDYLYRLTFDLSAFDPENVFLEGQWATDNLGGALILNGEDTGIANEASFTAFTSFRLETGFVPGTNTLDIPVNNAPEGDNPHGLIVANLRGGGRTEDPNLIGPAVTPFGQLDESQAVTVIATVRNSGRTQVLDITEAKIVGANANLFTLGEIPAQLQPNETSTVEINLDPQGANGNFDALLEITTNDPSTPVAQFDISAFIPVSPNLIAHYKLDETDGERLVDASGFGRNGTFITTQGSLTLGQDPLAAGSAASFSDGAMAEVSSDVFPVFEEFSISLWHVPGETDGATSIVSRGDGAGDPFALVGSGTTLLWFVGGSDEPLTLEDELTLGEPHHLVVTVANGQSSVYINGALMDAGATPPFVDRANNSLQFGAANGILGINGSLDDIQIYNRGLTSDEVSALFTNPGEVVGGGGGNPIVELPALSIRQDGTDIVISWPGGIEGIQLQSSADMQGFDPVPEAPVSANGESTVTLPRADASYFRLLRQP